MYTYIYVHTQVAVVMLAPAVLLGGWFLPLIQNILIAYAGVYTCIYIYAHIYIYIYIYIHIYIYAHFYIYNYIYIYLIPCI